MKQNITMFKPAGKSLLGFGQLFKTVLVLTAVIFSGILAKAQSTANGRFLSFDFSPVTATQFNTVTTYKSYFGNTTYIDTVGVLISRGAGTTIQQTAGSYGFSAVNAGTEALAISGNDYVEFQVKPKAGNEVRLDSLILRWQFSSANISVIHSVRTSTDGYATTLGTTTTTSSATAGANNITKITLTEPLYESDTFTVRIYIAGPSGGGTNGRIYRFTDGTTNNSFNHDISLWGRVSTTKSLMQAFDFSSSLGSESTRPTYTCNNTYIDTAGIIISRGAGLSAPTTTAGSYGAGGINTTSQANAITANDYFEFKLKPKAGYEYSLDRILIRYNQTTTGTGYALRSSQNNYVSNIASGTLTQTANTNATEYITLLTAGTTTVGSLVTDSSITYRLYVWGTATARTLYFTDGTTNNSFNYDVAFYGDMTTAAIPQTTLSAAGSTSTCLGGGIQLNINTLGGTAPYTVVLVDNLGQTRSHSQPNGNEPITIYPQSNRTYTIQSVTDVNANTAVQKNGSVSVTITSSPVARDTAEFGRTLNHLDGYTLTYADSTGTVCKSWVTIADAAGGTNPGSTRCTATVLNAIPVNNTSRYFLSRHLRIQPTTNGNATVTLFFTQQEFTAFNTAALYHQKLPANSTDTVGVKSKLLIRRTQSSTETASLTSFTPTSVTWNTTNSQWEVTINVNDGVLGGYYYVSSPFNTSKMVGTISHTAVTPTAGNTTASVTIDWPDATGVTQYRFRFRPVGSTVWNVSTITGSQRIMSNLPFNTSYELQIRVFESGLGQYIQGEYSNTYTFTTPLEPNKLPTCGVPTNISASATSPVSAFLSWTAPSYKQNVVVEMRAQGTLNWGGTSTVFDTISLTYLTPGTTYEYRLRTTCLQGYTENGVSSYTSIGTFNTPSLAACGTVTGLNTVSTTTNTATVSWAPLTYATSYQVQMRLKNTANWGGTTTTQTSISFNNLSTSSVYEYQVRAFCNGVPVVTSNNTGAFSATAEFTTDTALILPTCLPPTNVIATATPTSITVSWDTVTYGPQYFVQIKQATATTWGGSTVTGLSRVYNNLTPSTDYHVRVRTTCTPGATLTPFSMFSDTVFVTTTALANKAIVGTDQSNVWQVYPNPTRENLHVDFNSQSEEPVKVEVRDMTGRLVETVRYTPMIGSNTLDINLQSAADGLYLIHIYQGQTLQFMNKIQKTH